jgi:hypothetical protein
MKKRRFILISYFLVGLSVASIHHNVKISDRDHPISNEGMIQKNEIYNPDYERRSYFDPMQRLRTENVKYRTYEI